MRVIINADDLGLTHEANMGVCAAFERGLCTQATLVVNSDYSEEAAQMAHEHKFADRVGLHLNLSSNKALSASIRKFKKYVHAQDELHYIPLFMQSDTYGVSPLVTYINEYDSDDFAAEVEAVREEIDAQIQRFQELGFRLSHVDSHNNVLVDLPVWLAARPAFEASGFKTMRCTFDSFITDDMYNQAYALWLVEQRAEAGLVCTRYSSSVQRYLKRRDHISSVWFAPGEPIEIYVHPVVQDGALLDNFTGGIELAKNVGELDGIERTSHFELWHAHVLFDG